MLPKNEKLKHQEKANKLLTTLEKNVEKEKTVIFPKPKREIDWNERTAFVMNGSDLENFTDEEVKVIIETTKELKKNRNFSSVLKKIYFDYVLQKNENDLERIAEIIKEKIQLEQQYEDLADMISEVVIEKIKKAGITFSEDTTIGKKINSGEKLTKKDISKLLKLE